LTTNVVVAPDTAASPRVSSAEANGGAAESRAGGEDGESLVWEANYSTRNFVGRAIAAGLITVVWAVLAWELRGSDYRFVATLLGIAVLALWVYLGQRMLRATHGHHYRLTTRRLFVSNGLFRRRVDQIEVIRIKDLYVQQSMLNQWLDVGTVVVISSEPAWSKAAVLGVDRPHTVRDLIWQNTRREQDRRTTAIEQV
jgi:hypothetical protein